MRQCIADRYPHLLVELDDENQFQVNLITPDEISQLRIPDSRSPEYVELQLAKALPAFGDELDVVTKGVTYSLKVGGKAGRKPLFVKLEGSEPLLEETDAVFDVLGKYGVVPRFGSQRWFNFFIGSFAIHRTWGGEEKQRFRFALSDILPKSLILGPGIVDIVDINKDSPT